MTGVLTLDLEHEPKTSMRYDALFLLLYNPNNNIPVTAILTVHTAILKPVLNWSCLNFTRHLNNRTVSSKYYWLFFVILSVNPLNNFSYKYVLNNI